MDTDTLGDIHRPGVDEEYEYIGAMHWTVQHNTQYCNAQDLIFTSADACPNMLLGNSDTLVAVHV